jgi:hypothetical protein
MKEVMRGAKIRFFCSIASIFAVLALSATCFAYRPFITEDAGVAGKGVVQLEASWDYMNWKGGDVDNAFLLVPIYGVTERLEMSLEIPYLLHNPDTGRNVDGIGDMNVVGKYLIFEEKDMWPAFAFKGAIKTDSGPSSKGLGTGDLDYSLVAVASKTLGPFTLHTMFGYTFVGDDGDPDIRDMYLYGFAADYAMTETFHLVSEIAGNRNPDRTAGNDPITGLIGAYYKISEKVTVDGGMRFGFNDAAPQFNSTLGVTLTF